MSSLLLAHATATWFMVGLIWTIQSVHYPLFRLVGADSFARYEAAHTRSIGRLLVVPAIAEVVTAGWLAVSPPPGVSHLLILGSGALLALVWLLTVFILVPLHRQLSSGFASETVSSLIRSNWPRTWAWSVRGVLALAMLIQVS